MSAKQVFFKNNEINKIFAFISLEVNKTKKCSLLLSNFKILYPEEFPSDSADAGESFHSS